MCALPDCVLINFGIEWKAGREIYVVVITVDTAKVPHPLTLSATALGENIQEILKIFDCIWRIHTYR